MEAIRTRQSVRAYQDKPIPKDVMTRVLEAGRLAPSAGNRQEWRFVVVKNPERRKVLAQSSNHAFVGQCPAIIAVYSGELEYTMPCGYKSHSIDAAIAIDHMTLAAVELGLGTCWIGGFDEPAARKALGLPDAVRIVELLTIGYPDEETIRQKKRLALEEITTWME